MNVHPVMAPQLKCLEVAHSAAQRTTKFWADLLELNYQQYAGAEGFPEDQAGILVEREIVYRELKKSQDNEDKLLSEIRFIRQNY